MNIDNKKYLFYINFYSFNEEEMLKIIIKIFSTNKLIWTSEDEKIDFLAHIAKQDLVNVSKYLFTNHDFSIKEFHRYGGKNINLWAKSIIEKSTILKELENKNNPETKSKKL